MAGWLPVLSWALSIFTVFTSDSVPLPDSSKKLVAKHNTIMDAANPHVIFSKRSVVLFTPIN